MQDDLLELVEIKMWGAKHAFKILQRPQVSLFFAQHLCEYVYVHLYIVYTCIYVYTYIRIYVYTFIHLYICTYIHICIHMHCLP